MKKTAKMKVSQVGNSLKVEAEMPVLVAELKSGQFLINLPLFGDMECITDDKSKIETIVKEMVESFVTICDRLKVNLDDELSKMGWKLVSQPKKVPAFSMKSKGKVSIPAYRSFNNHNVLRSQETRSMSLSF